MPRGVIVGRKEELEKFLEDSKPSLEFLGKDSRYYTDNLLTRLFLGFYESRIRKMVAKRARELGADIGVITSSYSCSSSMHVTNSCRVWAEFYRINRQEAAA